MRPLPGTVIVQQHRGPGCCPRQTARLPGVFGHLHGDSGAGASLPQPGSDSRRFCSCDLGLAMGPLTAGRWAGRSEFSGRRTWTRFHRHTSQSPSQQRGSRRRVPQSSELTSLHGTTLSPVKDAGRAACGQPCTERLEVAFTSEVAAVPASLRSRLCKWTPLCDFVTPGIVSEREGP